MGGCRMGRDATDSVTDGWGRVHGVPWLFVADSSLFPQCSEVNPYVTVMALADRVAEGIRNNCRGAAVMKTRAAKEIARALVDEGVRFTFGIPGTHNIELYDALATDDGIETVLVTSEVAGAFLADGFSRSSDEVGVINVVPGAGVTYSMSGIAEAWMDNVPMVVLASGIRSDTGAAYQLHAIDQLAALRPITKEAVRVDRAEDLYPTIRRAFQIARSGAPGPVAVEIPAQFFMLRQEIGEVHYQPEPETGTVPESDLVERAAAMLADAESPALYLGQGCGRGRRSSGAAGRATRNAGDLIVQRQGRLSRRATPCGCGTVSDARRRLSRARIMDGCDCLLAIGCRFGEVTTGRVSASSRPRI